MKNKIILSIAIALPILIIIAVALSVYLPARNAKPSAYNFVFESNDNYAGRYEVINGKISTAPNFDPKFPYAGTPKFYIHDTAANTNMVISLVEAQKLSLSDDVISPDGYKIESGGDSSALGFIFGAPNNYNKKYIVKNSFSRELNIPGDSYAFHFLGWIIK